MLPQDMFPGVQNVRTSFEYCDFIVSAIVGPNGTERVQREGEEESSTE